MTNMAAMATEEVESCLGCHVTRPFPLRILVSPFKARFWAPGGRVCSDVLTWSLQGRLTASAVGQIVGLQSDEIKQIASEYAEKVGLPVSRFPEISSTGRSRRLTF